MNFAKLFGKKGGDKKAPKQDKVQQTQLDLEEKIKQQELKIENIEKKANNLQEQAKAKLRAGDKGGAKRLLAQKKKYVEQMKQIEGAMAMMEEQRMMLENAQNTVDIVTTIKNTNQVVKGATKGVSVEDLEDLRGEMEDMKATQDELNDFFKDYAAQNNEDVEEELDKLEEEMAKEDVGAMPVSNKENLGPMPAEKVNDEADLNAFLAV